MVPLDMNYAEAIAKAEALKTLGQTVVWLRKDDPIWWEKIQRVEKSSTMRNGIPTSIYLIAEEAGLELKWELEIEAYSANGQVGARLMPDTLREAMMRLPPRARYSFISVLREIVPVLSKMAEEWRLYLRHTWDSLDRVNGVIAYGVELEEAMVNPR